MSISTVPIVPRAWRALAVIALGAGSSAIAVGEPRDASRSFADRVRYGPGDTNHPVNVRPSQAISIPQGWPVDSDGSITCLTCHTKRPSLAGGDSPSLRESNDTLRGHIGFCGRCHIDGERPTAGGMHWRAVRLAHVKVDDALGGRSAPGLDSQTRACLECHDGVTARESRNTLGSSIVSDAWDARREHPVGVPYPGSLGRLRESAYIPKNMLPPQVQLPGGKVSCVSCHNLYAGERNLLTVPIEGSALCFACHSMR